LIKYLLEKLYRPWLVLYLAKDRKYTYESLTIQVRSGVFHPKFFYSTHVFLQFLKGKKVAGKKVLELGAGTGLISLVMAKRGAIAYASDISHIAIDNIKENSITNNVAIRIIHSDLFDFIQEDNFDFILINPPYYPRNPNREEEHAWYCGEDFQYFKKLFSQLTSHVHSEIYMILSEDCAIETITDLAKERGFEMTKVHSRKNIFEENYIFRVVKR
jgi:release factor glutamine methyltransferase